jgi:hypothetical protein
MLFAMTFSGELPPPSEKEMQSAGEHVSSGEKFRAPDLSREEGEMARTARELSIPVDEVRGALDRGQLTELSEDMWARLENSDSFSLERGELAEAEKIAKQYKRDLKKFVTAIKAGDKIDAPLVLMKDNEIPYLVAGNTRLMAARVLGLRPRVWLGKLAA